MARVKSSAGIEVHGLKELARALKQAESGLPNALRDTNKEVAKEVATKATGRAQSLGGVAAHVAPSIRASAGARFAAVAGGGASSPAFAGAEFGGRGRPTTQQFQPHLGTQGYFLYPTIRDEASDIEDKYTDALNDLMRKADLI